MNSNNAKTVVIADYDFGDVAIERAIIEEAGLRELAGDDLHRRLHAHSGARGSGNFITRGSRHFDAGEIAGPVPKAVGDDVGMSSEGFLPTFRVVGVDE